MTIDKAIMMLKRLDYPACRLSANDGLPYREAIQMAIDALKDKKMAEENPPLTPEEQTFGESVREGKIYRAALQKWGILHQMIVLFEEMSELQQALCKNFRGEDNVNNIAEEIADVKIMLEQMIERYGCADEVRHWKRDKLKRLELRIGGINETD